MKPSIEQMAYIYAAWNMSHPPLKVAKVLRLSPHTVIAEYVRLDDYNPSN
jgi:hypothetical protein